MTLPRMDSRIGLDYIVENCEYTSKLGAALDTSNTTVKKQVFELLSALCAYNTEGYLRALETLDYYKNLKNERYRFKVVINELENATVIEYQVALLAFINCVIISASSLQDRIRIRNEFIGLNILHVLKTLRREAVQVADIVVQLDVFDEQRECDEAQSLQAPNGINLSSHLDIFYAILRQVADTPQEIPFLSILQHLLRIDPKEPVSDIIWDTTEKLVHRATLLENHEDSVRLLRVPSMQKFSCQHCRGDATSPNRKQSTVPTTPNTVTVQPTTIFPVVVAPPPPPPPLMTHFPVVGAAPPAPPPPASNILSATKSEKLNRSKTPEPNTNDSFRLLPQQETPVPKTKMKTINWNKIPPNKVLGKRNIWAIVADSHQNSPMADLDWSEMEGLFCLQTSCNQGSPKLSRDNGHDTIDRKSKKESAEITLLDGKRSLNVNIFLKQFRSSNEDIIQLIKDGEHEDIGSEKLRGLLKILPEVDELDMLRSFNGDKTRLGNAEKFLMQLIQVPNYKLRIESMLLKEEFAANISYLEPCINAILFAGDDLVNNKLLQEVLYMVVVAGNFLNSGGYAGNAAGVKLSSLQKLTDIRANKPGMNLIHFVALQAAKRNPELLTFPEQMGALENASRTTSEQITNEIITLDSRIKKIKKQIELPTTESDIKNQMTEFLLIAEREVNMLQEGMKEVGLMRTKLSDFFCEDPSSFKLEECFKIFQSFCEKFKLAVTENERRRKQEEQAAIRMKQREEQLARRTKLLSQNGSAISDTENILSFEQSQLDMRYSPAMSRRRVGSFNSCGESIKEDGQSPDITPNGTLRRRRSRILSEDDEGNLMEFLRNSGHDNGNRERKHFSYGSLDRSWARRATTGGVSRKRPDLLSIDFGSDRERPSSPSPLAETKAIPTEEIKPRISREWRKKIESWLQSSDDKHSDDYKRRRRQNSTKRSFENDSETEKSKLDPLPEEKATNTNYTTNDSYSRVYPDWKPSATFKNTDVVSHIEAIEDARSNNNNKTNLKKVNTNTGSTSHRLDKEQSNHVNTSDSPDDFNLPMKSKAEEAKRKSVIQKLGEPSLSDRLQIYIRRPSDTIKADKEPLSPKGFEPERNIFDLESKTKESFSKNGDKYDQKSNKIEIDSDNIETPPVARRILPQSKPNTDRNIEPKDDNNYEKMNLQTVFEKESLGDGNFDRFSSARRTRRYKRPTDYKNGSEEYPAAPNETNSSNLNNEEVPHRQNIENKEERLRRWQDRLKNLSKYKNGDAESQDTQNLKLERGRRHISSINQEDVQEAIRNLKSPTETPERIWNYREISKENQPITKISNFELNDEGFEETQSLVSDTPSHGKDSTSSCNEGIDSIKNKNKPVRMTSTDSTATTSSDNSKSKLPPKSSVLSIINRSRLNLDRSRSMRISNSGTYSQPTTPRRINSLRKTDSQGSVNSPSKKDVERSSSRASLRSSRSSLNSTGSTSTIRKVPLKVHKIPSVESTSNKKPLSTLNSSTLKLGNRVPASRSSSSGSSIGSAVRRPPIKLSTIGHTNLKENQNTNTTTRNINRNNTLTTSKNSVSNIISGHRTTQNTKNNIRSTPSISGFMRPTASSTTKRQQIETKTNK